METIAPAATRHEPSCELINDNNLVFLHNIINIPSKQGVCLEGLIDMVKSFNIDRIIKIFYGQLRFHLSHTLLGQDR